MEPRGVPGPGRGGAGAEQRVGSFAPHPPPAGPRRLRGAPLRGAAAPSCGCGGDPAPPGSRGPQPMGRPARVLAGQGAGGRHRRGGAEVLGAEGWMGAGCHSLRSGSRREAHVCSRALSGAGRRDALPHSRPRCPSACANFSLHAVTLPWLCNTHYKEDLCFFPSFPNCDRALHSQWRAAIQLLGSFYAALGWFLWGFGKKQQ